MSDRPGTALPVSPFVPLDATLRPLTPAETFAVPDDLLEAARKAHAMLTDLGANADEVAASLAAFGVQGHRCRSAQCPIAAYLIAMGLAPAAREVNPFYIDGLSVMYDYVAAAPSVIVLHDETWHEIAFAPPPAVRDFIANFDAGHYPDLVVEPAP